jgi:molecular chaperone DnaK (HSP70)
MHCDPRSRFVANAVQPSSTEVSLGIDLGTTFSVAAIVRGTSLSPELVPLSEDSGDWKLASVVAYRKRGDPLVGEAAVRHGTKDPENTFYSVKRLIGKSFEDIDHVRTERFTEGILDVAHKAAGA